MGLRQRGLQVITARRTKPTALPYQIEKARWPEVMFRHEPLGIPVKMGERVKLYWPPLMTVLKLQLTYRTTSERIARSVAERKSYS